MLNFTRLLRRRRRPEPPRAPDRVLDVVALLMHHHRCNGSDVACTGPVFEDYAAADKLIDVLTREGHLSTGDVVERVAEALHNVAGRRTFGDDFAPYDTLSDAGKQSWRATATAAVCGQDPARNG